MNSVLRLIIIGILSINAVGSVTPPAAPLSRAEPAEREMPLFSGDPPQAAADSYTDLVEDTVYSVVLPGVLGNDTDTENDGLTAVMGDEPEHGALTLNADGSFTYTPDEDYNGGDSFTYRADDSTGLSLPVVVSLTIAARDDVPVAVNDAYSTPEDTTLTVAARGVLANDRHLDQEDTHTLAVDTQPLHGSVTLNNDGSFSYIPEGNYHGADSFTYHINDGTTDSNIATVEITIESRDDTPTAVADSYPAVEDSLLEVPAPGILTNDLNPDQETLTIVPGTGPAHGELTLHQDGSFNYNPDLNFNGDDTFRYALSDGTNTSAQVVVTLSVDARNDLPTASANSYDATEDVLLEVAAPGVLLGDTDVDNDPLTAVILTQAAHGTVTLNTDGSFSYDPNDNFNGIDTFTYAANDGTVDSAPATVTLDVDAVNDTPTGTADAYETNEDTPLTVTTPTLLANDSDPDTGDILTASIATQPLNGEVELNNNGTFTYTPDLNFNGDDPFTYTISDGTATSLPVTVTITVNPVNDAPTGETESYTVVEDHVLTVAAPGVLGNDYDVEGTALTAAISTQPAHGEVVLNSDGSFEYTPDENFAGDDSFTYTASDGELSSAPVIVNIEVTPVNDPPTAVADTYGTLEDTLLEVAAPGFIGNDTDPDPGDTHTATLVDPTDSGTLVFHEDGSFTYDPDENFNGSDSFSYYINDGLVDSNTVIVTINVTAVNDAPTAVADAYSVDEDTLLTVNEPGVLVNDSDVDTGDVIHPVLVSGPSHGQLTLGTNGSIIYDSNADYAGTDSFTYRASDGRLESNLVTVTITVNPINDAPVAVRQSVTVIEDTPLSITVSASDVDQGDVLVYSIFSGPGHGTLTGTGPTWTYTPGPNSNAETSFTFLVSDGLLTDTEIVNITITPVNDAPVAVADEWTMGEDGTLTVALPGVLSNDTDVENNSLSVVPVAGPNRGTLTLNTNGSFTYRPNANINGTDSFTYRVSDGALTSASTTVTIRITPINDAPVAVGESYVSSEDVQLNLTSAMLLSNDSDVDTGDVLSISIVSNPTHGTLTLDGSNFRYQPAPNYNGNDSFSYRVYDGTVTSNLVTVSLTISAVNDAPATETDDFTVGRDGVLSINAPGLLVNDSDVENDDLTTVLYTQPTDGTLTLHNDGSFEYLTRPGMSGTVTFTYRAYDGVAYSTETTVTIEVVTPQSIEINWISPTTNNRRYRVGAEDIPLDVAVRRPDNLPCGDCNEDYPDDGNPSGPTNSEYFNYVPDDATVVRYFRWNAAMNRYDEVSALPDAPYTYMLDTGTLNYNDNEIIAVASITVNKLRKSDGSWASAFTYTSPRQRVFIRRYNWDNIYRGFLPSLMNQVPVSSASIRP